MHVGARQQAIHLGHPPLIPADHRARAGPAPPARHRDRYLAETRQELARVAHSEDPDRPSTRSYQSAPITVSNSASRHASSPTRTVPRNIACRCWTTTSCRTRQLFHRLAGQLLGDHGVNRDRLVRVLGPQGASTLPLRLSRGSAIYTRIGTLPLAGASVEAGFAHGGREILLDEIRRGHFLGEPLCGPHAATATDADEVGPAHEHQ